MEFSAWERAVSSPFQNDPIWRMTAFRMSVYLLDQVWDDIQLLRRHRVLDPVSAQLYRAVGSIGANLSEGYTRSSGMDRVRLYEYALGSTRESQLWYYASRHVMPAGSTESRFDVMNQIGRILLTVIPKERRRLIRPRA